MKITLPFSVQNFWNFANSKLSSQRRSHSKGAVTPYRLALTDVRWRTKFSIHSSPSRISFLSVSHSANALLVRQGPERSIRWKVLCMQKTWNGLHWKKAPCWMYCSYVLVLFGTLTFLVLYLSSSHPLMSGGPDLQPNYYLTYSGSTGGVLDTDRMFNRWLLTRNAWKLTNNGCEAVVRRTKLMMYIFWGIIKRYQYKNVWFQFVSHALHFRCTFVLPGTCPLLVRIHLNLIGKDQCRRATLSWDSSYFYTPPHKKWQGIMLYPPNFECLSVVRPSAPTSVYICG